MSFIDNLGWVATLNVLRGLDRYVTLFLGLLPSLKALSEKILEIVFFLFNDLFFINRYFADGELHRGLLEVPQHSIARH